VFWLGHMLDEAQFSALPARSVSDAALLMLQLDLTVDLLIVNPALPGGLEFIAASHRQHKEIRVIAIVADPNQVLSIPGVNATHPKPVTFDEDALAGWMDCIERVLANHQIESSTPN
jgi:hypothetical protein